MEPWEAIRAAQAAWAAVPVRRRLPVIRRLRFLLVREAGRLAAECAAIRGVEAAEVLTTELLPLAEACRFLESESVSLLETQFLGRDSQPIWLSGVHTEVRREPLGVVLILSPSNYPLFLAGSQMLQALIAGNAVLLKPAPGASAPLVSVAQLLQEAGLPEHLLRVLPEDLGPVHDLIRNHVDKVLLTGGTAAGQAILKTCAEAVVPATVELSGLDSFHVLADADPARAADVLLYALGLNRGRTCIAPRRIFAQSEIAPRLRQALRDRFRSRRGLITDLVPWARQEIRDVLEKGATIVAGAWAEAEGTFRYPLILERVPRGSRLCTEDHFAPIAVFEEASSPDEALRQDRACPYALGSSVFGADLTAATAFAGRLPAPMVTINDAIVPTADPRLPFGGRKKSGFGVTRGPEGLLELTAPRVIARRASNSWLPHLDVPSPGDEERFQNLLHLLHGDGWWSRFRSLRKLLSRGPKRIATTTTTNQT